MTDLNPSARRLFVLYEYGEEYRPYSSSFLRLIRPLSHPKIGPYFDAHFGLGYNSQPADVVMIDRLWRPDVSLHLVEELVNKVRLKGMRLVYSLDDDYFDLEFTEPFRPASNVLPVVTYLLRNADAVLVTTSALRQRVLEHNQNVHILPNVLDERLLVYRPPLHRQAQACERPIVIGYMGTGTHDQDLKMIVPALQSIHKRHAGKIEIQLVGVVRKDETRRELEGLPVRYVFPRPEEHEYPLFMLWFTASLHWDIAISPLANTPFNSCKSDIKFLDYSAIGAAGIYSQSPAYAASVNHRQNGLLVENSAEAWVDALEILLEQPDLRMEIAQNASKYLYAKRILSKAAADWVASLQALS